MITLPSGRTFEERPLTGKDWQECLYHARKKAIQMGFDIGDLGYWERYEEKVTGWTREKLDSLSFEDAKSLRVAVMEHSNAGPSGPQEKPSIRKN